MAAATAEGEHGGGDRPLHVRRAAAVEAAVALLDDVLAAVGHLRVVRRDDVVVADEREGGGRPVGRTPAREHVAVVVPADGGVRLGPEPVLDGVPGGGLVLVTGDRHEFAGQRLDVHAPPSGPGPF